MAGVGDGDAAGDGVVDGVDARGEVDLGQARGGVLGLVAGLAVPGAVVAGAAEAAGDLVQRGEDVGRFEVEQGQGAYRRAQFAHRDGGAKAPSHDVADDEGGAVPGQFDHVEPVAADLGLHVAGEVAAGDVEPGRLGVARGQEAALQYQRALVLAAVEAGVVDTDGGP